MDTLRETLEAAMQGDDAPDEVVTPEAPNAPEPAATAPEAPAAPEAAPEGATSPERDEHGRFKPKTEIQAVEGASAQPPADPTTETAKPAGPEPQTEAIRVPPSLPAAMKAKFASLDPDVREAFVTLEGSVQKAKAEWDGKGQRLNRYDEIIGPHVDRWRMNGLDEFSGIQSLIAAQSLLDRDPVSGMVQIARSYGLTPAHLAQAFGLSQTSAPAPAADGQQPATAPPDITAALQQALQPFQQGLQTLQQQFTQSQQATQATQIAAAQREVDAFMADPANMYFTDVSDAVADYIAKDRQAGGSMTLQQAYDRAIWADPTIRPHLLDAQTKAAQQAQTNAADEAKKAAEKAQREKAEAARKAGGSVTGSPTPGAQAPAGAPGSVRDSLRQAMQEHGAA